MQRQAELTEKLVREEFEIPKTPYGREWIKRLEDGHKNNCLCKICEKRVSEKARADEREKFDKRLKENVIYCENRIKQTEKEVRINQIERIQKIIDELNDVKCVGMSDDFIKGSDWCNHLWRMKIQVLKQKIESSCTEQVEGQRQNFKEDGFTTNFLEG